MTKKEMFEHILNGGQFFVQYGKTSFSGNLDFFKEHCRNIIDYMNKPCSYFSFGVYSNGCEYSLETGFKSFLKSIF